jgi:stress response protein YsnF
MKTVIGAFSESATADLARDQLSTIEIEPASVRMIQPAGSGNLLETLRDHNVPDDRANLYAEACRRGASLLIVDVEDDQAQATADLLDRNGSLDLSQAEQRWRSTGWSGYEPMAQPFSAEESARERTELGKDLDVLEEEVGVGKREVGRGGVQIRSYVVERPVHEQVALREERIDVTREPANEPIPLGAADQAFTEDEFEVTATGEEAVVEKQARVVERVRVDKVAETHDETIEDTERRREVEVEQIEPERQPRH